LLVQQTKHRLAAKKNVIHIQARRNTYVPLVLGGYSDLIRIRVWVAKCYTTSQQESPHFIINLVPDVEK
jgi:hypothetical protein